MDKRVIEAVPGIISGLNLPKEGSLSAFTGFDACIDYIVKIVREKKDGNVPVYFNESSEFGRFLTDLGNRSCGIELETRLSKIGGNMVIQANSLGNLGVNVDCAGTFGLPEILPFFHSMSANCRLHSIGDTISATALEFSRSKVIMFDPGPYDKLTWEGIRDQLGIQKSIELVSGKGLVAFLNWSEIWNSSQIWRGFLDEILPFLQSEDLPKVFFTDFSDCSRRSKDEIQAAIGILAGFKKYSRVILSLNQNEAELVARALGILYHGDDAAFIRDLYENANADVVAIHRTHDAIGYDGKSLESCDTFFCDNPVILTGGGDNFNAGLCFSALHDLSLFESLIVANAVSGLYVRTGASPGYPDLLRFLKSLM
jgi:hypothetical protein